jgi:hypothetical protein
MMAAHRSAWLLVPSECMSEGPAIRDPPAGTVTMVFAGHTACGGGARGPTEVRPYSVSMGGMGCVCEVTGYVLASKWQHRASSSARQGRVQRTAPLAWCTGLGWRIGGKRAGAL